MRFYFAGSITGGRDDAALYAALIARLKSFGTVLTEHIGSGALTSQGEALTPQEIHDRDLAWLLQADFVVAEVTVPSLGVGYEIGRAVQEGIPVLALFRPAPGRRLSAMIAGCPGVEVFSYRPDDLDSLCHRLAQRFAL